MTPEDVNLRVWKMSGLESRREAIRQGWSLKCLECGCYGDAPTVCCQCDCHIGQRYKGRLVTDLCSEQLLGGLG